MYVFVCAVTELSMSLFLKIDFSPNKGVKPLRHKRLLCVEELETKMLMTGEIFIVFKINIIYQNIPRKIIFQEIGLKITVSKTETMAWNWYESSYLPYPEHIKIMDVELVDIKHFKYISV